MDRAGFATELWEGNGHPVLFAERRASTPQARTVLIYGHYDVQPVDPLELWESPPFEPTVRNGEVFARGAQDNKGQCFYSVAAVSAIVAMSQEIPLNIKFVVEGEEECGSANLHKLVQTYADRLRADYVLAVDLGYHSKLKPGVTLGTRGIGTFTVKFRGATSDLHSGTHGGVVINPNHALVKVLSSLRDDDGTINVPGFYDGISPLPDDVHERLNFEFDAAAFASETGAKPLGGERRFSPVERAWTRPTLEINGIGGGYTGEGFKTVIPAVATAKLSCRLVADQDPIRVVRLVKEEIVRRAPEGIDVIFPESDQAGHPVQCNPRSWAVRATHRAYEEVLGREVGYIMVGGSIPILAELTQVSGGELAMVGLGLGSDNMHAPNEHFGLDRFRQGFLIVGRIIELLAKSQA
jgi:acetylornithine deacetylase/succinyl-diaminopimelate desuccinylase-like protein